MVALTVLPAVVVPDPVSSALSGLVVVRQGNDATLPVGETFANVTGDLETVLSR